MCGQVPAEPGVYRHQTSMQWVAANEQTIGSLAFSKVSPAAAGVIEPKDASHNCMVRLP